MPNRGRKRSRATYDAPPGYRSAKKFKQHGREFVPRTMGPFYQTEKKYFDSIKTSTALATTWTGSELDPTDNTLFAPQEGNDIDNRNGRKVFVKTIRLRGLLTCDSQADQTATDEGSVCRLILYMDSQANGTQSQGEDLMGSTNVTGFQNLANLGRFRVLKDKTYVFQNPAVTYDGTNIEQQGLVKYVKWNITFKNPIEVNFNATNGGTIADIVDNAFHVIGTCNNAELVPKIVYQCRIGYIDR